MSVNLNETTLDNQFWNSFQVDLPEKDRALIEEVEKEIRTQELAARALASQNQAVVLTQPPIDKTVTVVEPRKPTGSRDTKRKSDDSDYALSESDASSSDTSSDSYKPVKKKKLEKGGYHHWTSQEDNLILKGVEMFPNFSWTEICTRYLPHLNPKQVRQRYHCYLDPHIKKGPWTEEELKKLKMGIKLHGLESKKKWQNIAEKVFNGQRTGKECQEKYVRVILRRNSKPEH